jgi:DNA-binding CsgD family transcriptional regulator
MLSGAALMALGDDGAAKVALEDARRLAGPPLDNAWLAASADYQLGELARRDGRARDAERLHHEALAVRHEPGFVPGVIESLEALATLAADAESDRESARLLAACATARTALGFARPPAEQPPYDDCLAGVRARLGEDELAIAWAEGEALTIDEAVAYASRARSERKRPSSGWDALTPMEQRVVALAAEGLTNPQIAEKLFVARGTVKIHLSHVFSKLGVSTRAELASEATRRAATDVTTPGR